ncbi:hypothetical protein NUW54_g9425 [Trametes sanguinea]|uniref:Uncharacterized protein n=1 Tax=Trametes sanguinea TaxID=158606 RepID=A0ACC1P621_9APHY|nr:hypothetical protein NUW54_g9425 [Trametes sanguinea]
MSLISTVRAKFLEAIRSVNPPGRWKILVVDEHSQRLLGSVLKQFDILEENVTLIESITSHREPQPQFEAMYLLMSTSQNVDRIIRDFSNGHQQYAAAHLFFVDALPLQPCNPTFLTARDAWIQADQNRYNGANKCILWNAFASRGLGVNAANHNDDSTVPAGC